MGLFGGKTLVRERDTSYLVRRTGTNNNDDGHINLFPEAKDSELNLVRGTNKKTIYHQKLLIISQMLLWAGMRPRKSGIVPFYMRSNRSNDNQFIWRRKVRQMSEKS